MGNSKSKNATPVAFPKAKDLRKDYNIGQQIGEPGAFGTTYLCTKKSTGETHAVKRVGKRKCNKDKARMMTDVINPVREEVKMLQNLAHPNIIRFFGVYENKDSIDMVFEVCSGGELFDRIKQKQHYSERDAASLLRQLLVAIAHMHKQRVLHADLKPDNILFEDEREDSVLKVIDFGLSKVIPKKKHLTKFRGTPYYVAPEVLAGAYDMDADIWSFGVIMFMTLLGFPPFFGSNDREILQKIRNGFTSETKPGYGPYFPDAIPLSDGAKEVISSCLISDPTVRSSAEELLQHSWFTDADDKPLVDTVLSNIVLFQAKQQFKQEVLKVMTDLLSESEFEKLAKTFKSLDTNSDGKITVKELKNVLQYQCEAVRKTLPPLKTTPKLSTEEDSDATLVIAPSPILEKSSQYQENEEEKSRQTKFAKVVSKIMEIADVDGDGALSYEELMMQVVAQKLNGKEQRLWAAFEKFDKDHDGQLTVKEIEKVVGGDPQEIEKMIVEVDSNNDGKIDFDEFITMWMEKETKSLNDILESNGLETATLPKKY